MSDVHDISWMFQIRTTVTDQKKARTTVYRWSRGTPTTEQFSVLSSNLQKKKKKNGYIHRRTDSMYLCFIWKRTELIILADKSWYTEQNLIVWGLRNIDRYNYIQVNDPWLCKLSAQCIIKFSYFAWDSFNIVIRSRKRNDGVICFCNVDFVLFIIIEP